MRVNYLTRVVVVIVEGLGLTELASIHEWQMNRSSSLSFDNSPDILNDVETTELDATTLHRKRKKRRKDVNCDAINRTVNGDSNNEGILSSITDFHLKIFKNLMPQSFDLFPVCLEVESPSQYSLNPSQELISSILSRSK